MAGAEPPSLKETCLQAVRKHFAALDTEHVLDLPAALMEELLPQLTVCQLDELQPGLNQRGISTHCGWAGILKDMHGPNYAVDLLTEDGAKHEVMRMLFPPLFYGLTNHFVEKNLTNLNTSSFMLAAAKYIKHFLLYASSQKPLQSLIVEQQPLLNLLEKQIRSVAVLQSIDLLKRKTQAALYVLHRLLDHGVTKKIVVDVQCPIVLAWLLHGRGSQYENPELKSLMLSKKGSFVLQSVSASADGASCSAGLETRASEDEEDQVIPCKRSKMEFVSSEEESGKASFPVDPKVSCGPFSQCDYPSSGTCPQGQIECLEVRQCGSVSLSVLRKSLPTFFCLRSLTLHSFATFRDSDVLDLARGLKQLSESSRCSLTYLNIGILPFTKLMEILLDAVPKVTSLHVEILHMMWGQHHPQTVKSDVSELPLQKLTVKVTELQTDLHFITSVLRRSPHLTSLHLAGMNLPTGSSLSQLLITLSESNHGLRSLNLEDLNLSDCLPDILNLLRNCQLEELWCNDCRLLEKCSDKEEALQQLVSALRTVPSLHTLSLAQNRLTKNVCVLSELFSGSSPSSVKRLNISYNFIQPAELLEFAHRLRTHRPPQQLTLDLRMNPGDRDPDTWNAALNLLRPLCVLLLERWKSTDTMVDHISNM
ncbi:uncharacterized protein lrrc41 isoform X2 [Pleuronectes platessa]|uniref:uncharacterized protein lrrc41 isoform X2 n=1 Tax=Pleuronectes platessa TaxID=8262 RepID=UPI00232A4A72|nr:uncharacterized protein lrrc41 isoform X2 [Pleuronectes platessa]